MSAKNFPLDQVLTVATNRLLCKMADVYTILNFLTGDDLCTHQLPRSLRECGPWIIRQHPQLAGIKELLDKQAEQSPAGCLRWLVEQEKRFGAELPLSPIPRDDHEVKDPVKEMEEMVGKDRMIVIDPNDD